MTADPKWTDVDRYVNGVLTADDDALVAAMKASEAAGLPAISVTPQQARCMHTLARSVRPYPTVTDIWRMITRTAYVQLRFSPLLLVGTVIAMALVWLVPPAAFLFSHGAARLFGLIAWIMQALSYLPTLERFRRSMLWAPLLPLIAGFYTAATIGSALNHYLGKGVAWKGRAYQ